MNTKILSERAMEMINQYKNFHIENSVCSIPYFNNKVTAERAGLRARLGKGSPKDIFDEVEELSIRQKIAVKNFSNDDLKNFLIDNNIGIDCSGFVYYILNEECISRDKGSIDRYLSFPFSIGIIGKIKSRFRPVENTDVKTLAHNKNSRKVEIKDIKVGDIITMIKSAENELGQRDHIIIIYQIEYQNFLPITLHYVHSIAWPTDGQYGHGIHEGKIDIIDLNKNIIDQRWIELDKSGEENHTYMRAGKSLTEIRRLNCF